MAQAVEPAAALPKRKRTLPVVAVPAPTKLGWGEREGARLLQLCNDFKHDHNTGMKDTHQEMYRQLGPRLEKEFPLLPAGYFSVKRLTERMKNLRKDNRKSKDHNKASGNNR